MEHLGARPSQTRAAADAPRPAPEPEPEPEPELWESENLTVERAEAALKAMIGETNARSGGRSLGRTESLSLSTSEGGPEKKLQMAELRYRLLVEKIPAITFLAAMEHGLQEFYVSPQIESVLGFTQKEWVDNPVLWYTQLHPDDRNRWQTEFARTIVSGEPFRSEYRFLARDGRVVWVRGEAQIVRDDQGQPLFLQGIAFDISEQKEAEWTLRSVSEYLEKEVGTRTFELARTNGALNAEIAERERAERALSDREALLRSIIESAVDGIISIDERGRIESFNPAAERIFGYRSEEVLGRNVGMLMPEPYQSEHDKYLLNYVTSGDPKVIGIGRQVLGRRKDGSTFPLELSVSETLTCQGRKFTGITRDITERKCAEQALLEAKLAAETANRLKGEFLANMSHEIRTPMNGILGMTDLALSTRLTSEQRAYLQTVKCSADALLTLINDILDFSKIEAGKLSLDPIDFALRETIGEAIKPLAVRAQARGLELALEIGHNIPDRLIGDPGRLRQILINLVDNAIKFTTKGEVVIEAQLEPGHGGDPRPSALDDRRRPIERVIHFSVRDTGIGIAPDKQRLVFDSFTQADGSTTRLFGGTGLGLSISRRLVELMGGRIWLESVLGQGTTFHFVVRLEEPGDSAVDPGDLDLSGLRGLRVLIVDDNATNAGILARRLAAWQMVPSIADSGTAALAAIRLAGADKQPFPLVLLDSAMPDLDGFAVRGRMHEQPGPVAATIMMLSTPAELSSMESGERAEMGSFVIKPVQEFELLRAIRSSIHGRREIPVVATSERPTSGEGSSKRWRILLAEDNEVNQKLATHILRKKGHQVDVASDGIQALAALDRKCYDLVLMDVQMPVMDGLEATAAIRERERVLGGRIPVIALTASAMTGDRELCLQNGFDEYLSKPIHWPTLETLIDKIMTRPRSPASPDDGRSA